MSSDTKQGQQEAQSGTKQSGTDSKMEKPGEHKGDTQRPTTGQSNQSSQQDKR